MRRNWKIVSEMFCAAMISGILLPNAPGQDVTVSGELSDAEFRRLHQLLQPQPDESWRTIPWTIALLDAQRNAARQQKPIFIWAMDGHPLGCT